MTIFKNIFIFLITLYQAVLSPDHNRIGIRSYGVRCRYYPSCSAYAAASVRQYGLLRGSVVSLKRIIRCHPFSAGGYDPVPSEHNDDQNDKMFNRSA